MILSIDPGNTYTAYTIIDEDRGLLPVQIGKIENNELLQLFKQDVFQKVDFIAIEMVACYGMAVGATIFDTCVWIGRYMQLFCDSVGSNKITFIYRKDEKMELCGSMKAKDANITQALIDRFAPNTSNKGKGSKKNQGWFYGFAKDIWAAYAVGVTFYDMNLKQGG